jgi:AcrR family transcriptional regulator
MRRATQVKCTKSMWIGRVSEVLIGALYRRYASKEDLFRRLRADGIARYIAAVEAALNDLGDPWEAFARFMHRGVDAVGSALTLRLAGTFQPTDELILEAARAGA